MEDSIFRLRRASGRELYRSYEDRLCNSDALALIETVDAGETRLPVAVIKSARRKLTFYARPLTIGR